MPEASAPKASPEQASVPAKSLYRPRAAASASGNAATAPSAPSCRRLNHQSPVSGKSSFFAGPLPAAGQPAFRFQGLPLAPDGCQPPSGRIIGKKLLCMYIAIPFQNPLADFFAPQLRSLRRKGVTHGPHTGAEGLLFSFFCVRHIKSMTIHHIISFLLRGYIFYEQVCFYQVFISGYIFYAFSHGL